MVARLMDPSVIQAREEWAAQKAERRKAKKARQRANAKWVAKQQKKKRAKRASQEAQMQFASKMEPRIAKIKAQFEHIRLREAEAKEIRQGADENDQSTPPAMTRNPASTHGSLRSTESVEKRDVTEDLAMLLDKTPFTDETSKLPRRAGTKNLRTITKRIARKLAPPGSVQSRRRGFQSSHKDQLQEDVGGKPVPRAEPRFEVLSMDCSES